ncbi:hypothetical protein ALC57_15855 [Trachymyrmex cornetzi]|uniref:Uncharacterized protein n=1 Tax=Trachymyrmex cornetzi TaxID=471704 RepID=A0A151IVY4_9HYME|nr:hypothetical protein ALC57_15855 [Trachymyrmex cornetzi]
MPVNDLQSLKQRIVQACKEITYAQCQSQYFLNEAFASILAEENFVCFEVVNSYLKFDHLTREHPVELETDYVIFFEIPNCRNFFLIQEVFLP